jgi:hypothetical protein
VIHLSGPEWTAVIIALAAFLWWLASVVWLVRERALVKARAGKARESFARRRPDVNADLSEEAWRALYLRVKGPRLTLWRLAVTAALALFAPVAVMLLASGWWVWMWVQRTFDLPEAPPLVEGIYFTFGFAGLFAAVGAVAAYRYHKTRPSSLDEEADRMAGRR